MVPLVSIIIPVYNREKLIGETLESISAQTYKNWECIVVDDGSKDGTEALVSSYAKNDKRIKFYRRTENKNSGASSCRNIGLEKAEGELIQFLDSDDLIESNKLEEQIFNYRSGTFKVYTCKWGGFEESSDLSKRYKYKYHSYKDFRNGKSLLISLGKYKEYFPLHVYLTPRALIEKSGTWNEDITNNDDAEFFTRVILNSSGILFSDKTSVYYRYNSTHNLSELNTPQKVQSAIKSWSMIESNIKKLGSKNTLLYARNGKLNLLNAIQSRFPDIVNNNQDFFKDENNGSCFILRFLKEIGLIRS